VSVENESNITNAMRFLMRMCLLKIARCGALHE